MSHDETHPAVCFEGVPLNLLSLSTHSFLRRDRAPVEDQGGQIWGTLWDGFMRYCVERVGAGRQGLCSVPSCSYHSLLMEHVFVEVLPCAHWENTSEQDLVPSCLELLQGTNGTKQEEPMAKGIHL